MLHTGAIRGSLCSRLPPCATRHGLFSFSISFSASHFQLPLNAHSRSDAACFRGAAAFAGAPQQGRLLLPAPGNCGVVERGAGPVRAGDMRAGAGSWGPAVRSGEGLLAAGDPVAGGELSGGAQHRQRAVPRLPVVLVGVRALPEGGRGVSQHHPHRVSAAAVGGAAPRGGRRADGVHAAGVYHPAAGLRQAPRVGPAHGHPFHFSLHPQDPLSVH